MSKEFEDIEKLWKQVKMLMILIGIMVIVAVFLVVSTSYKPKKKEIEVDAPTILVENPYSLDPSTDLWVAPKIEDAQNLTEIQKEQLLYGKDLISNTSKYFGPRGSVAKITNGMNCQNCHLDAGTKPYGNNYGAVFSTYPKYRARSGAVEDIYKRVADCFERSLNGTAPVKGTKEMEAIVAYINFTGSNVEKGKKAKGSGIYELKFLDRPADPVKGKIAYQAKCQSCHQANGEGQINPDKVSYQYPPLWGKNAYNSGAGLYRVSRFAGYIKANMPFGVTYKEPQLTDEEAWDIAAYVNNMPHPGKDISKDWPKIEEKTFDHPFGPFADGFTEEQHKFGPFGPIKKAKSK
jgi:thiosulfate dehydrogenase